MRQHSNLKEIVQKELLENPDTNDERDADTDAETKDCRTASKSGGLGGFT